MAVAHGLGQGVGDPGTHPDHCGLLYAESFGDQVDGTEADPPDIAGEPVGVFGHHLHRVGAVGLEDAHCARCAVQEHHDLADRLLVRPCQRDPVGPLRSDLLDLAQPLRAGLDDVEYILAEQLDHAFRIDRSNAPDHS